MKSSDLNSFAFDISSVSASCGNLLEPTAVKWFYCFPEISREESAIQYCKFGLQSLN